MTNAAFATNSQAMYYYAAGPYRLWAISVGNNSFGILEWERRRSDIYIFRHIATVPFSAPVVAAGLFLIILLLLVAGYYLIANLRHKSVPDRDKLD